MSLVGGGIAAYSQYQKGAAQEANAKYNANLAESQAEMQNLEARENVRRQRRNNEQQLATARAQLAAQGSVANAGAPLELMGEIAGELELQVLDSYRKSESQRSALYNQAKLDRRKGKTASKAGKLMALSTGLSTGVDFYDKREEGKRTGII